VLSSAGSFDAQVYHHIVNVVRLKAGEKIELVQRDVWLVWLCQIEEINTEGLRLRVLSAIKSAKNPFSITLVVGSSKRDTVERVIRQATELGTTRIIPTLFDRSISRPSRQRAEAKIARLRKIANAAAQQSHRIDLPTITDLQDFPAMLELLHSLQPDTIFTLWEEESSSTLSAAIAQTSLPDPRVRDSHVVLVIGPEGGITLDEIERLRALGGKSVSLGTTILRVDTAACAAIAIARDALAMRTSQD